MINVIQKNFKLLLIALIILIVGGVFVFVSQPNNVKALDNGDDAVDVFGQWLITGGVDYDHGNINNGPTVQSLYNPSDVALDETNNKMYVADTLNNRVLVYEMDGTNTLIDLDADYVLGQDDFRENQVGTTATTMDSPVGLAMDSTFNVLFVTDSGNERVLVYDFGLGAPLSSGRAADYVIGQSDFVSTAASTSSVGFSAPKGIDYDSENQLLYVVDSGNERVMVFDGASISTGMAATYALGELTDFNSTGGIDCTQYAAVGATDVEVDEFLDLVYVGDASNNRVTVYDYSQGGDKSLSVPGATANGIEAHYVLGQTSLITCVSDEFTADISLTSGGDGKVYAGDAGGESVGWLYVYDLNSYTVGVEEAVYDYRLNDFPSGLAYNFTQSSLYLVEGSNHRGLIYNAMLFSDSPQGNNSTRIGGFGRVGPDGEFKEMATNDRNNGPNDVGLDSPTGVIYDEDENWLIVSDYNKQRIVVYDRDDGIGQYYRADKVLGQNDFFAWETSGLNTPVNNNFARPEGMAIGTISGVKYLFVADSTYNRVLVFNLSDGLDAVSETAVYVLGQVDFTSMAVATTQAGLSAPVDLAFDDINDILYIADADNYRVVVHDFGVAGLEDGRMADNVLGQSSFDTAVAGGYVADGFSDVFSVAVDESGGVLFVEDRNRIVTFDVSEGITDGMNAESVLGAPDLMTDPSGYSADASSFSAEDGGLAYYNNKLYVADTFQNRVLIFDVETIVDEESAEYVLGQSDFFGNSSSTTQSTFNAPVSLAFSGEDDYLYVVDQDNNRVMVFSGTYGPTAPSACGIDSYTNSSVTMSWTDNSSDEDSFTLEKSTDNATWSSAGTANSNVTTGTATGLSAGTLYYFRVVATNALGDSDPASCGSITTSSNNAPDNLTVDLPTENEEDVPLTGQTFTFASGDPDEDIFYYRFELSTSANFLTTLKYWDQRDSIEGWPETYYEGSSVDDTAFTLPENYPLDSNTTYYWRARAQDLSGAVSEYMTPRSFTTIESSEEEKLDLPYVTNFNGFTKGSGTTMVAAGSSSNPVIPATNTFAVGSPAFGTGKTSIIEFFDADNDADLDIIVGDWTDGLADIYLNDGSGTFTFEQEIFSSDSFGIADFDYDGDLDIATGSTFYENTGGATFSGSTQYASGAGVEIGDFNSDGYVDILTYQGSAAAQIYLNDGTATFTESTPASIDATTDGNTNSVSVGDFDGDFDIDIAVFNNDGPSGDDSYLFTNDGGMVFTRTSLFNTMNSMQQTEAVDIDDDGDLDLLISQMGLYLNDGEANFTISNTFSDSGDTCDVSFTYADVDGDGDQDVLCSSSNGYNGSTGQNQVFRNKGYGLFADGESLFTSGRNTSLIVGADIDGDGDIDLVEGNGYVGWNETSEQNYIYLNNGSLDFDEQEENVIFTTKIFDSDNDGDMDMWGQGEYGQRIFKLNNGDGSYSLTEYTEQAAFTYDTISVDVNGDGYLDIIEANREAFNSLWINDGSNSFVYQTSPFGAGPGYYQDAVAADVDGDGDQDVMLLDGEVGNEGTPELWLNDGSGDFSEATDPFGSSLNGVMADFDAGDIDGDGDIDVVLPMDLNGAVFINDGTGTFTDSGQEITLGGNGGIFQLGDMDNDGDLDLFFASISGLRIYLNDSAGNFDLNYIDVDSTFTSFVSNNVGVGRLVDLDNDNDLDIFIGDMGNLGASNIIYRNYGNLSFVRETGWFDNADITVSATFGDYDSDGDVDIFVRNSSGYGTGYRYENRQTHAVDTDYEISSGTIDSTADDIYSATLNADINEYVEYSISQVPLSYDGVDYDDWDDGDGGLWLNSGTSFEFDSVVENDTDITSFLMTTGYSNLDLQLNSVTYDDGEVIYVSNDMTLSMAGLYSSQADVNVELAEDGEYVSGGNVLFAEDVFVFDALTGEYTFTAPEGVTAINTWQSGSPLITKSTVGTVQFDLYNGGGGEPEVFSDVTTDDLVITDDINDLYYRDFGGGAEVVIVAGDNGLVAFQSGSDPWEQLPYDEPVSGPVDFNGIEINGSGDAMMVGAGGYIYFYSADELIEDQICHVAGTPIYSNDMNAISIDTDYAYVVGSDGLVLNIDFTDQNNIVCTDESVVGVTVDLNDVKTFDGGGIYTFIVGDSGTYIADYGVGSFTDYTDDVGVSEDFNGVAIGDNGGLIVGDNGTVIAIGDTLEALDTGGVEDYYDGILSGDMAFVVGSSGSVYYTDDTVTWSSLYAGALSTIYSIVSPGDEEEVSIAGASGLLKEYSGGSIEESDWETVTNGTEHTFAAGGSDLRVRMVVSTDSAYRTPVLNGVSISYSTTSGDGGDDKYPPTMPRAEKPDILSSTSIQWNFADTADNEASFKFYDEASVLISEINETDLEHVVEKGLSPNTAYQRSISAYNSDGESSLADLGLVYTLANVPGFERASVIDSSSVSLSLNVNENSNETEYAIYEVGTESWLNSSGLLGDIRSFQTESDWLNGGTGIVVSDLTENAMYSFKVMAKNGDDVLTELSVAMNIIVHTPVEANLIITKKVGVNVADEVVGVYFGQPVFAGTETAEKLRTIPLIANLANMYIAFTCFMMILFLFLVVLNASPCCRKVKHAHKLLFTDLLGRRGDDVYHSLHGEGAVRHGRVYKNHKHFYRFTNWGVIGVFFGLIAKVGVVLITAFIVYGGFQVHAFENQSGDDVLVGDVLTYQIDYINNGDEEATNVVITDVLPAEVSYVDGSLVNEEECSYAAGLVSCSFEALSGDAGDTIEFKALVSGDVGETVINVSTGTFTEGEDVVSSNSVTNEIVTNEEPVDCGAGETCEVIMGPGWNFFRMVVTSKVSFSHLEESHAVQLTASNTVTDNIGLRITSDPIDVESGTGEVVDVDSDGNGLDDMKVKAQTIESDEVSVVGIMLVEEVTVDPFCGDLTCNGDESCSTCAGDCGVCPPAEVCGNAVCGFGETCSSCTADCGACPVPEVCGNAVCGGGETCSSCSADCGVCPVPVVEVCGNAVCGGGETCSNCAADCGSCPVPPVGGEDEGDPGGSTTACSDGLDNDGDGLIDLADAGCENEADLDETDVIVEVDEEEEAEVQEILEAETTDKIVTTISTVVSGVTQEDFAEVKAQVKSTVESVVRSTKKVTAATINNPTVERVNDVAQEPVVVAATVSSVTAVATVGLTGATGASLLTYLQFIFTQPFMLITRRKKRGWGVVYNSITKRPSDLAIVRLYDYETKKLVQTRVTDKMGRYEFIVKPGKYFLEVSKKEYKYPAELLDRAETDGEYQDVYYGDPIIVGEEGVINRPIPLDPDKKMETGKQIKRKLGWKKVQSLFTLLGPILAMISFIITPELWIGSLIVVQLVIYFIFKRLADAEKPVSWGMVKDALSGKSLKRSIVRVFDTKFNKLLDTQVTEKKGKYAFLVGNNEYYMTTEKEGYQPHKTDVYDMSHEESGYLAKDIPMIKEGSNGSSQDGDEAVAVRSDLGRQSEKEEGGVKKVVRNRDEKFAGEIKDVDLDELHEDFYDVDSLRKN